MGPTKFEAMAVRSQVLKLELAQGKIIVIELVMGLRMAARLK